MTAAGYCALTFARSNTARLTSAPVRIEINIAHRNKRAEIHHQYCVCIRVYDVNEVCVSGVQATLRIDIKPHARRI